MCSDLSPAEDEALLHVEGVNDALQHPRLQTLHSLRPVLRGVYVGPSLVEGMGPIGGGGRVGLEPGPVLMGVKLHTHMVYCLWHILFALQAKLGHLWTAREVHAHEYIIVCCADWFEVVQSCSQQTCLTRILTSKHAGKE